MTGTDGTVVAPLVKVDTIFTPSAAVQPCMRRRTLLTGLAGVLGGGAGGYLLATGRVDVPESPLSAPGRGDTRTLGNVEITVTDAMTTPTFDLVRPSGLGGDTTAETVTAPDGGTFGFVRLRVANDDIVAHDAPRFSTVNYGNMESEGQLDLSSVNDLRVCAQSKCGTLPPALERTQLVAAYRVNGAALTPYGPHTDLHPTLAPNSSVAGWVLGLIPAGETPTLHVVFKDSDVRWVPDETTAPPTPNSTVSL